MSEKAVKSVTLTLWDEEYDMQQRVMMITMMAVKHSLVNAVYQTDIIDTQTYYVGETIFRSAGNVKKFSDDVKANGHWLSGTIAPFAEIMSLFADFVSKYGGYALSHSTDNDYAAIAATDKFLNTGLFIDNDVSKSPRIPKWKNIKPLCSQQLIGDVKNSRWSAKYRLRYPHDSNELQELTKELGPQEHRSESDCIRLKYVAHRLCDVSDGHYVEDRKFAVICKPPPRNPACNVRAVARTP
jgi:hypothetical protein